MSETTESRADHLMRTSEVYRRLMSQAAPLHAGPALDLPRDIGPVDTARALPPEAEPGLPPPGPSFLRRLLTRRIDSREVLLLLIVLAVVLANRR